MSSKKSVLFFVVIMSCFMLTSVTLKKEKINKQISMKISEELILLPQERMSEKHVSMRPPLAIYSTDNRQVDLTVSYSKSLWGGMDIALVKDFYKSSIVSLFDEVKFVGESVELINKKEFILLEFESKVSDIGNTIEPKPPVFKYHYMLYALHGGRALIFNFTCPLQIKDKWRPVAISMMQSIKIK